MGAKQVVVEEVTSTVGKKTKSISIGTGWNGIGVKGDRQEVELGKFATRLKLNAKFGRLFRRKSAKKAKELLRDRRLDQDHQLSRFVDMALVSSNPLKEYEFDLGLTDEASKQIAYFLNIGIPTKIGFLTGHSELQRKLSGSSEFNVIGKVTF